MYNPTPIMKDEYYEEMGNEHYREELLYNDQISAEEQGFLEGYYEEAA